MTLRILFLGMQGAFAYPPLKALIDDGHALIGLVTPAPPGFPTNVSRLTYPLPTVLPAKPENIYQLAVMHGLPIFEIGRMKTKETITWLHTLAPDLIVIACFNRLLPEAWLETPRLGCINLHPSLLPAYRGPTPLEDQLGNQETTTGITLHFLDEGMDTGDIIVQQPLGIPVDTSLEDLNRLTAELGAGLLLDVLKDPENIPRTPQPRR